MKLESVPIQSGTDTDTTDGHCIGCNQLIKSAKNVCEVGFLFTKTVSKSGQFNQPSLNMHLEKFGFFYEKILIYNIQ